jgi:hypothetical protein
VEITPLPSSLALGAGCRMLYSTLIIAGEMSAPTLIVPTACAAGDPTVPSAGPLFIADVTKMIPWRWIASCKSSPILAA